MSDSQSKTTAGDRAGWDCQSEDKPGTCYFPDCQCPREICQTTDNRTPAGRVWLDLVLRFRHAATAQDNLRVRRLEKIIDGLESEYPGEIAAEKALWDGGSANAE